MQTDKQMDMRTDKQTDMRTNQQTDMWKDKPTHSAQTNGQSTNRQQVPKPKILYAASTQSHLIRFHQPYIEALRRTYDVKCMAKGKDVAFPIAFEKSLLSPANLKAVHKIRRVLRQERFDGVILNTSLAAFLIRVAMIGMRHRPRVLNIVHGYLFTDPPHGWKDRLLLWCEQLTRKQTDRIAVMNAGDLEITRRHRLCLGDVCFLHGMGFCPPDLTRESGEASPRALYAVSDDDWLLTFVGELSGRKNQIFLIRALERLRREGVPVRLMLVGEGTERETLEAEIRKRGLEASVFLTGNREPVFPYLAATDLYVSASRSEGLPFNLMEAMSCGLPVIASDVKGQNDLLHAYHGSLYPPDDMEAFCRAVREAVASGKRGCGAVSYPTLEHYRLEAVFAENLQLMKGFLE